MGTERVWLGLTGDRDLGLSSRCFTGSCTHRRWQTCAISGRPIGLCVRVNLNMLCGNQSCSFLRTHTFCFRTHTFLPPLTPTHPSKKSPALVKLEQRELPVLPVERQLQVRILRRQKVLAFGLIFPSATVLPLERGVVKYDESD